MIFSHTKHVKLAPTAAERVLVVDDDEEIRDVFQVVLSEELPKCTVESAVNGADGFECFQRSHHRVILMDLHMPVMDGEEAFREIEELCEEEGWETPAVIFCTAYNPPHGVEHLVSGRKHALLRKPVPNDLLVSTVKSKLGL